MKCPFFDSGAFLLFSQSINFLIISTMSKKPTIPSGTRDFNSDEMLKRNYIFDTIREHFRLQGFLPIETPAMENLSTLLGKYGEEGDKLLFRVLNSGDFLKSVEEPDYQQRNHSALAGQICDKGLRYDLTVPFARFVVQHRNDIVFPFKRYQIQSVWRADRPQKGRYREFCQCDADIIGSNSLINEAELIFLIDEVFASFGISVLIKINNRKVLAGIAEVINAGDKLTALTVAIDKLDKAGKEKVLVELAEKGFIPDQLKSLDPLFEFNGDFEEKLTFLDNFLNASETGKAGISEIRELYANLATRSLRNTVELDLALARGLNYYTGAIIEVKARDVRMGSICGGGRYDDLTGIFGMPGVSGVGISFGADRIYDVLEKLNSFPVQAAENVSLMFANFGEKESRYILSLLPDLRAKGVNCEIYPDAAKMKKQFSYADNRSIPWVAIIGEDEMKEQRITLKNMKTGEQETIQQFQLLEKITNRA